LYLLIGFRLNGKTVVVDSRLYERHTSAKASFTE
jgi:hypothetical protein